jgi:ribulose bisphosphate carboxylase small subunit
MYKIERQLSDSKGVWACFVTEYKTEKQAIAALKQKRGEYPHSFYRIIKFEVIDA